MRSLTLASAALAVVSGIVSVNLWRELRAERQLTFDLRARLEVMEQAPARTTMAPDRISQPVAPQPVAAINSPAARPDAVIEARPVVNASTGTFSSTVLNTRDLLKDPEYRKAMLAQLRLGMPQNYPGLAEDLGLTQEEAGRLFDLMAENQVEMNGIAMPLSNGAQPDPVAVEEWNRSRQQKQRDLENSVESMLGSTRYAQYQEYQETRPVRQQVAQLGQAMETIGQPLSEAQARPLRAVFAAEQKRSLERSRTNMVPRSNGGTGPVDRVQMMEENLKLQSDSNRRILEAAQPHLTVQQLEALRTTMDQQLVMNRASLRLMRQQMGANK